MIKQLAQFIWENKKWWMIPPIIILVLFGVLVYVTTATPVSPFIYVLF
jgi:ABC-type dipeptide/oligopeptide/nickel transport system permease subunit